MKKLSLIGKYLRRNTHRSFPLRSDPKGEDIVVFTRTSRAQEAVKKAKEIVSKNNKMVEELKKSSELINENTL